MRKLYYCQELGNDSCWTLNPGSGSSNNDPISDPIQKCNFPHPFSDLAFTLSLLRLECKQNNSSNPFRIRIFLFLPHSSGIETINTFIHSVVPSKTIPDSRPKWAKCIPVFRPKWHKTPTPWGGTYLRKYIHTCLESYTINSLSTSSK